MPAIWFARFATLNEDAEAAAMELEAWQAIYEKDVAMMERSDIIIANLTVRRHVRRCGHGRLVPWKRQVCRSISLRQSHCINRRAANGDRTVDLHCRLV